MRVLCKIVRSCQGDCSWLLCVFLPRGHCNYIFASGPYDVDIA